MTTDTRPKRAGRRIKLGGKTVTVAGVAKGAGMIHPNMATLLAFVTTDAAISKAALTTALRQAVNQSFNRVTVDGDTSTNDMLAALANGAAENEPIRQAAGADFEAFTRALTDVCRDLAIEVARDGEEALEWLFGEGRYTGRDVLPLPAIVLLDLKLPRVDGFEVLRRIREHPSTRLLPVIVLTSSAQERDLVRTYASGANSYIVKPVDFEQFLESALQIGMYWLMLNRNPPPEAEA